MWCCCTDVRLEHRFSMALESAPVLEAVVVPEMTAEELTGTDTVNSKQCFYLSKSTHTVHVILSMGTLSGWGHTIIRHYNEVSGTVRKFIKSWNLIYVTAHLCLKVVLALHCKCKAVIMQFSSSAYYFHNRSCKDIRNSSFQQCEWYWCHSDIPSCDRC